MCTANCPSQGIYIGRLYPWLLIIANGGMQYQIEGRLLDLVNSNH